MKRGLSFSIPQKTTDTLFMILHVIQPQKYYWKVIQGQSELWTQPNGDAFLEKESYTGTEFYNEIQKSHYIVFLKLLAFSNTDKILQNVHTFKEYIRSSCQIVLLVYDCEYVEIYLKDKEDLVILYNYLKINNYANLSYIYDESDSRYKMDVL